MSAVAHEQPPPPPSPAVRRSPRWIGWLGTLTLAAGLAGGAWSAAAYVRLVRLHVQWVDGCARAEAAGRAHLALVDNLLHMLPAGALDSALREAILTARLRTSAAGTDVAAFRSTHGELRQALAALWERDQPGGGREVAVALWGLEGRLEHAQARVTEALNAVEDSAGAYRAASAAFPASLVASFVVTAAR